jgi:tRNA(Ile)-lysidine synthase
MFWLENEVAEYMKRQQMLTRFRRVYVGLSGGADSVCLLLVLRAAAQAEGVELCAIHVHHHIRGAESDRDMAFCEVLCRKLQVPLTVEHVDVPALAKKTKESEELAARRARYAAFARMVAQDVSGQTNTYEAGGTPDVAVAVAHHRDDEDETMLFNMIRGTGLTGLCGMKPVRQMRTDAGDLWILRPLLCVGRGQIEAYLKECGQDYVNDSTNAMTDYTRNKIRHQVLPAMTAARGEEQESLSQTWARMRGQLSQIEEYMQGEAVRFTDEHAVNEDGGVSVSVEALKALPEALRTYVVREFIGRAKGDDLTNIEAVHIDDVCGLLEKQSGRRLMLPQGVCAWRSFDRLKIGTKKATIQAEAGFEHETADVRSVLGQLMVRAFDGGVDFYRANEEKIRSSVYTKWLDYDKIEASLCLRTPQSGDLVRIGADGGCKKLTRVLMEAKIDVNERSLWPVVADGEKIVWVCGFRIGEEYKITEETRHVAEVTLPEETIAWIEKHKR